MRFIIGGALAATVIAIATIWIIRDIRKFPIEQYLKDDKDAWMP